MGLSCAEAMNALVSFTVCLVGAFEVVVDLAAVLLVVVGVWVDLVDFAAGFLLDVAVLEVGPEDVA
jgi:hypothetical protein